MTGLDGIKQATWALHARAERSGIIADILAGQASQRGVALLWRNLLPAYQALDASPAGHPVLARAAAIEADLRLLAPGEDLPVLPEAASYADRIRQAAEGDAATLPAHAYVRYLGDLNGGRILQRLLSNCLGAIAQQLTFHHYPTLEDAASFIRDYRVALDQAVREADFAAVVQEATAAFEMNILLSDAVKLHELAA